MNESGESKRELELSQDQLLGPNISALHIYCDNNNYYSFYGWTVFLFAEIRELVENF